MRPREEIMRKRRGVEVESKAWWRCWGSEHGGLCWQGLPCVVSWGRHSCQLDTQSIFWSDLHDISPHKTNCAKIVHQALSVVTEVHFSARPAAAAAKWTAEEVYGNAWQNRSAAVWVCLTLKGRNTFCTVSIPNMDEGKNDFYLWGNFSF